MAHGIIRGRNQRTPTIRGSHTHHPTAAVRNAGPGASRPGSLICGSTPAVDRRSDNRASGDKQSKRRVASIGLSYREASPSRAVPVQKPAPPQFSLLTPAKRQPLPYWVCE